jgi:hypothetical protein
LLQKLKVALLDSSLWSGYFKTTPASGKLSRSWKILIIPPVVIKRKRHHRWWRAGLAAPPAVFFEQGKLTGTCPLPGRLTTWVLPKIPEDVEMNGFRGGAVVLLSCFCLAFGGGAAWAQSAGGFLDTIKGVVNDPVFGSLIMSKIAGPDSLKRLQEWQAGRPVGAPTNSLENPQSYTKPGYFYSIEKGARLGGTSYDPSGFVNTITAPQTPAAVLPWSTAPAARDPAPGQMTISKQLAPAELRQLSRFDITVLIDKSGSMSTRDCPDEALAGRRISRWEWCREQSAMLSRQTAGAMADGITVVPFADSWQRLAGVQPEGINAIFNTAQPQGSTNLAGALQSELQYYFQQRDLGLSRRPLMIAVITDGVPDSKSAVRRVIREATEQMNSPDEVKIVFFMIGEDRKGLAFVDELCNGLADEGARFNIVSGHTFAEVDQVGLPRSLAFAAIR